jgi:hypothetical protein
VGDLEAAQADRRCARAIPLETLRWSAFEPCLKDGDVVLHGDTAYAKTADYLAIVDTGAPTAIAQYLPPDTPTSGKGSFPGE